MHYEVEGAIRRGRLEQTWSDVIEKDCHIRQICKEDAMDHRKLRKLIKDVV